MQLIYRGIRFDASSQIIETGSGAVKGKYRGCSFNFRQPDQRLPIAAIALCYRKVMYLSARHSVTTLSQIKGDRPNQVDLHP